MIVAERHPYIEPPFDDERYVYADGTLTARGQRKRDALTHYICANGWTVSIRDVARAAGLAGNWGFEAWAWPSALGTRHALTPAPTHHDTRHAAIDYRDKIASLPADITDAKHDDDRP